MTQLNELNQPTNQPDTLLALLDHQDDNDDRTPPDDLDRGPAMGPGHRNNDPDTSRQAATENPGRITGRQRVLDALREAGAKGLTDEELRGRMPAAMAHGSASKRRKDLVAIGLVTDTGTTRDTRNGHAAIVWRALQPHEPGYGIEHAAQKRLTITAATVRDHTTGTDAVIDCHDGTCVCEHCNAVDCHHIRLIA